MTRTPEPRPGDILAALDELDLLYRSKVTGSEAYILCPYHDDSSIGSFAINLESGLNHCFACGNGGSFHRFMMAARGFSRQQARRWCLNRLIATTPAERPVVAAQQEVGEASLALFSMPPEDALYERAVTSESCAALGILWNPLKGSWVFPVHDPLTGKLLGWQEKDGRFMSNYPDGMPISRCLFGWQDLARSGGTVALVESPIDTAVMRDAGYLAVSSFGSAVSTAQLDFIADWCSSLVLALDDDEAGWKATDMIMRKLRRTPVKVFNYGDHPRGKDPGELDDDDIRWGMANLLC